IAFAQAQQAYEIDAAAAGLTWSKTVSMAKADLYQSKVSQSQYNQTVAAADDANRIAVGAAAVTRETAQGDALVAWTTQVAAADVTSAMSIANNLSSAATTTAGIVATGAATVKSA